jgi:hypothetical protein
MVSYSGRYTRSSAGGHSAGADVTFGADVSSSPVYLNVEVLPGQSFARLMLALGRVVRMQDTGGERDHSAYQAWVQGEYLKELPTQMAAGLMQVPALLAEKERLDARAGELRSVMNKYLWSDPLWDQRREFWAWLYSHNRDAWVVLDPIVSVQPDATFFEAFSLDESTYARVKLPHEQTRTEAAPVYGTTNIDFSGALERELVRTRPYRPLHLTVGADSVRVDTGISSTVEKKIDLPETWVRGLVEVQAALSLAPTSLTLKASALADVLARLESEREKHGPRSLLFNLLPGEPPRVTVEPWGEDFVVADTPYSGTEPRHIKVWGRRRLRVLQDLLPLVNEVHVDLIDSGLPSFWSVELDGIELTIGISGWTSQDWAGRARFSAMIPASAAPPEKVEAAAAALRDQHSLTVDEAARILNVEPRDARTILQRLCLAGTAMFDPDGGTYRWRALFPELNLESAEGPGLEERRGVEMYRQGGARITSDHLSPEGREVDAFVSDGERMSNARIRRDEDGRIVYAQCDCSHFRHHKLRLGPCRHIIATSLAAG